MPRLCLGVVLLATALALGPATAHAQSSTADGVHAILRGDYAAAVRILRPLAEEAADPDPLAQYFMAMLYESGHGVARDWARACGLYLNSAKPGNALRTQALDLARSIYEQFGRQAAESCEVAAAFPTPPAPPVTLTLAPQHTVTINATRITVSYHGEEKHTYTGGGAGFVGLAPRYTPVDVLRPTEARRHFIQFLSWAPHLSTAPPTWTLGWMISEIVGPDLFIVTGEQAIATVTAPHPPADIDVASLTRVGVNASGEAEWTVIGGANPRSGVVPARTPR
jgi:hypothetical protein